MIMNLKHLLKKLFSPQSRQSPLSLQAALQRTVSRETQINTVIDIGASNGCWSTTFRQFYPDAACHLIEANPFHQVALERLKQTCPNLDFTLAAAGDIEGEIFFDGSDPFGGLASHEGIKASDFRVPVVTVDQVCHQHQLVPPFLLKLDTHGFEVPIFEGAKATLAQTNLIVVETYNFNLTSSSLRFPQLCHYLEEKGFRCIDVCEPMFRDKDKALWQFDLLFAPQTDAAFLDNTWS
jgi:FkbM family methyltransferase